MYEVLWAVGCNCRVTSTLRNIQGIRRTPIFLQQRNRLDLKAGGSGCRKMTLDRWRVRSGKLRAGRRWGCLYRGRMRTRIPQPTQRHHREGRNSLELASPPPTGAKSSREVPDKVSRPVRQPRPVLYSFTHGLARLLASRGKQGGTPAISAKDRKFSTVTGLYQEFPQR